MYNDGRLSFGVNSGTQTILVTPKAYNDGNWHHLVATQGPDGMRLWVDTRLVGSNAVTASQGYTGYWRVGGDRVWSNSASSYFAGSIDEVAIYPGVLTEQNVREHFTASGRTASNRPPVAAFSTSVSYLRLDADASGSTDADEDALTYAWDFGDGTTASGPTTSKTYSQSGTYPVKLTVTDAAAQSTTLTKQVTVAANKAPVAGFTSTVTDLEASVDASASTDTDGRIASFDWDFGDGSTGTGVAATRTYAAAGTYQVSLTVTDDLGAQTTTTRAVTVAERPNTAPTASFTADATGLTVAVDASASTDADGSIASYAWDFGDGQTAVGASASASYGTAGTFTIRLTVTDDAGATATTTKDVTVVPLNQKPVAAFTAQSADQRATFDASGSSDPDGTITAYAWDFGDGTSGSGVTANRTYAAPGTYTVRLTVTDDRGGTDSTQRVVTATAPPPLAKDDFARSVTGGWGTADVGGPWSIATGASRWSVADGVGRLTLSPAAGSTAALNGVGSSASDTSVTFAADKVATGGGQYVSLIGRRLSGGDYRAKVQVTASGAVVVGAARTVAGTETVLTSRTVSGLTYGAGDSLRIRLQVTGIGSADVRAKVWKVGTPEPSAWNVSTTDATASLQAPGGVGVYGYLSGSTTNAPVVQSFDALEVTQVP
jgi:PKD repeat protein